MKKLLVIGLSLVLLAGMIGGGFALAGENSASKATAACANITWLDSTSPDDTGWELVLVQDIKTPNKADLFVDVSLLCEIFTSTEVRAKSQGGQKNANAMGQIMVRVSASDDSGTEWALPTGDDTGIVYAEREQELWASLTTDNTSDEMTIGLFLDTADAHSFNFIFEDLLSGMHTVRVEAKLVTTDNTGEDINAQAKAGLGWGSVTIEQVRMTHDEVVLITGDPEPGS